MESPSFSLCRMGISAFLSIKWEFIHNFGKHRSHENVPAKNRHKEAFSPSKAVLGY